MSSKRHHHRRQGGTTPTIEPQDSHGVAQFSVSEVAQFSVSLDIASGAAGTGRSSDPDHQPSCHGDPEVATWADAVEASRLVLAAITLQEQELAVLRAERREPTQGALLRHWLQQAVVPALWGAARHGPGPQAVS